MRHAGCGTRDAARGVLGQSRMTSFTALYVRHRGLIRLAWLAVAVVVAACNNGDGNGGAGDDGGIY